MMMMRFGVLVVSAGLSSACDPASLQTQINQIETVCCAGQDCTTVRVERHGIALSIACLPLVAALYRTDRRTVPLARPSSRDPGGVTGGKWCGTGVSSCEGLATLACLHRPPGLAGGPSPVLSPGMLCLLSELLAVFLYLRGLPTVEDLGEIAAAG
jgi:hypothetical protein